MKAISGGEIAYQVEVGLENLCKMVKINQADIYKSK